MKRLRLVVAAAGLMLAGCASVGSPGLTRAAACHAERTDSVPGRAWWQSQRWRYADDAAAQAAYRSLVEGQSPWPDWFTPVQATLPAGTRLQMAIGGAQTPEQPGGFATFDWIGRAGDVREGLAVLLAWKPDVDRVVTYETLQPMPVRIGPVGPQVDPAACRLLEGRWSQVQMMIPPAERMTYLRILDVRALPQR